MSKLKTQIIAAQKRLQASDQPNLVDSIIAELKSSRVNFRMPNSFSNSTLIPFDWDDSDDVKTAIESAMNYAEPKVLSNIGGDEYVEYPQTGEYIVRVNYADAYIILITV
jgi:hypothetical protein